MEQSIKQRIVDIRRGNVPAGYQKTKFGIIPADWNEVPLDSILQNVVRKVPKPQAAYWRLGVRSHAKGTFRELVDDPATVNMDELYSVRANDLVVNITFAWEHAIAIVNENDSGLLVSHRFPTYTFRNNASPDFYRYVVTQKWMKEQLDLISPGGAGRNRVMNKNLFLKISCYLPPLEEQRRIADILRCCDRVIALKKELIAEKKKQKKALMQKLLNPDSGFRLPGFSGERKIKTYAEIFDKIPVKKYQISSNEYRTQGLYPIIDQGQEIVVAYSDDPTHVFHCPMQGVIIFGDHTRELKYASFDFIIGADGTQVFTTIRENCLYMFYFCKMINIPNLGYNRHFSYIKSASFAVHSSLLEQQAIADILSAADKEIDLLEQELAQQEQKKKSLMQLLLTGIVRV